ncbi:uncharacterized protein BX664DRAFT_361834 [Halteromyces radiatus]|uniref:uncharacterized protein n=1 Tax=Halteromyces radiatus TaxID=101107 RepID=UPI00221E4139|nr:uncharacterized protein BX664DRAFT_361834 [Halteromyces radiatus]KAI8081713.1 hypothetical protein BX664DRAFT_361834 [Halteromyces radiatus]
MTMSMKEWQREQKLAVGRLVLSVLTENEIKLGTDWTIPWWQKVITRIGLGTKDNVNSLSLQKAIELVTKPTDIRIDILLDLLSIALNVDQISTEKDQAPNDIIYDARARQFLYSLTLEMGLQGLELAVVERSLGQQMYFTLQEKTKGGDSHNDDRFSQMNSSAKLAMHENNSKKKLYRWLATGAGVVGGGAVIALTGGLAAPLLAPFLVGLTGATFFATAGGIALVTSLFGLTGGGLAGFKMHRRTQGLNEFGFKQILVDKDMPPIPTLKATICVTGFLLDDVNETVTPWINSFENNRQNIDTFCLEYETKVLKELGYAFRRFLTNQALKYAGLEVAKQTALQAFFAAVALPATLLKVADIIDDPWQIAVDRSRKAGIVLADTLEERVQGNRPCNLIGYSCGSLVIWQCLQELHRRKIYGAIDHVVLLGSPIPSDDINMWRNAMKVVSGRFINGFTTEDWVLAYVYRLHSLETKVSGLAPVPFDGVENLSLDLEGHTSYRDAIPEIMSRINLE